MKKNMQFDDVSKGLAPSVTPLTALRKFHLHVARPFALLLLTALAISPPLLPLDTATIEVSNTSDSGAGSFREAIQSAAPGDTINFSVTGVVTLTNGELLIAKNLSIVGPTTASLAISGNLSNRVFEVSSNA